MIADGRPGGHLDPRVEPPAVTFVTNFVIKTNSFGFYSEGQGWSQDSLCPKNWVKGARRCRDSLLRQTRLRGVLHLSRAVGFPFSRYSSPLDGLDLRDIHKMSTISLSIAIKGPCRREQLVQV